MSRHDNPTLHLEWSPSRVTVQDIHTGKITSGETLADLTGSFGRGQEVLVGISRHLVFLKTLRLPKAAPEDMRKLLEVQLGQIFPLPAAQLTFDFFQTTDQNTEGWLTLVAAVRTDDLRQLKVALQQVGWKASRILPIALGSPGIAAQAGLQEALVLENSSAGLTLDVIQEGSLRFSRTVPIESDPASEAQRTLLAARANALPFLAVGKVELPEARHADKTALGCLHEAPPFDFELLEERVLVGKRRVASRTRQAVLLLAAAALLVTLIWADRSDQQAVVQKGEGTWMRQLSKLRSIRDANVTLAQQNTAIVGTLSRAFETGQPLGDITAVLGDSLPEGVWLTGVALERGKPVQLRGTAKTEGEIAHFVDALGSNERFRDVKLVSTNRVKIEEQPVVQFNLTAVAVGNLPMPVLEKKKSKPKAKSSKTTTASTDGTQ